MNQPGRPRLQRFAAHIEGSSFQSTMAARTKLGRTLIASTLLLATGFQAAHANPVSRGSLGAKPIPLPTTQSAPAQPIPSAQQSLKHFPLVEMLKPVPPGMQRRDIDPMELILGPDSRTRARDLGPLQPVERGASCEQLYNRVTVLLDQSVRTRPGIFDDPATSLFAALGAVAPPAYLLVGVSAIARLAEERHAQTVDQRIEMLRRRMADKRCYLD